MCGWAHKRVPHCFQYTVGPPSLVMSQEGEDNNIFSAAVVWCELSSHWKPVCQTLWNAVSHHRGRWRVARVTTAVAPEMSGHQLPTSLSCLHSPPAPGPLHSISPGAESAVFMLVCLHDPPLPAVPAQQRDIPAPGGVWADAPGTTSDGLGSGRRPRNAHHTQGGDVESPFTRPQAQACVPVTSSPAPAFCAGARPCQGSRREQQQAPLPKWRLTRGRRLA